MGEVKPVIRLARRRFEHVAIQEDWVEYEGLTHASAAEACAKKFNHIGLVETKDSDGDSTFLHHVEPRTVYLVKSLRGDS